MYNLQKVNHFAGKKLTKNKTQSDPDLDTNEWKDSYTFMTFRRF